MNDFTLVADWYTDKQINCDLLSVDHVAQQYMRKRSIEYFQLQILYVIRSPVDKKVALRALVYGPSAPPLVLTWPSIKYCDIDKIDKDPGVYIAHRSHLTGNQLDVRSARFETILRFTDSSCKQSLSDSQRLEKVRQRYYAASSDQPDLCL